MVPLVASTPREAVEWAIRSCGRAVASDDSLRLARIRNTLGLDELWVTETVAQELRPRDGVTVTELTRELYADGGALAAWDP